MNEPECCQSSEIQLPSPTPPTRLPYLLLLFAILKKRRRRRNKNPLWNVIRMNQAIDSILKGGSRTRIQAHFAQKMCAFWRNMCIVSMILSRAIGLEYRLKYAKYEANLIRLWWLRKGAKIAVTYAVRNRSCTTPDCGCEMSYRFRWIKKKREAANNKLTRPVTFAGQPLVGCIKNRNDSLESCYCEHCSRPHVSCINLSTAGRRTQNDASKTDWSRIIVAEQR